MAVRKTGKQYIKIRGANENNLKNLDVSIPLGCFTCVTGVSGSGKSSLVNGILYPYLARELNGALTYPGSFGSIEGTEQLDKVICIDQSPIGRTPRSNPATYTGLFTAIRELFSQTPDAKRRAYGPGRFSFNVKGGRCEACEGDGVKTIEMHFLPDVYVQCDVCKGKRYNKETLEVHYKDKSIADVLDMTVSEGVVFFENIPKIHRILKTMEDVGLGYRAGCHHPVRRRSPESQAGHRAFQAQHRQNHLHSGRTHHRTAHRRCAEPSVYSGTAC